MKIKILTILIILLSGGGASSLSQSLLKMENVSRYHEVKRKFPQIDQVINEIKFSSFEEDTLIIIRVLDPLSYNYEEFCVYTKPNIKFIKKFHGKKKYNESDTIIQRHKDYYCLLINLIKKGEINYLEKKSKIDVIRGEHSRMEILFCEYLNNQYKISLYHLRTIDLD